MLGIDQGLPAGLLTDLYQLTMAAGYVDQGLAERDACFHLFFRKAPFRGSYAVAAGLEPAMDFLRAFRYDDDQVAYLSEQEGNDGEPLFGEEFLDWLRELQLRIDVDALPEGTVVFPDEPILRVTGPLPQCQLLETALLTIVNFQTLIATKAARIRRAAGDTSVVDFGLRRAHGLDGGVSAARAAYVGGVDGTSNVHAGHRYGIPVMGTHAHSWVMTWDSDPDAFRAWAESQPNNCTFLVDTYDTLEGVRHAVEEAGRLRERGHEMVGIRLDSGDMTELSKRARKIMDDAGFEDANIVASSELDEYQIREMLDNGAKIDAWGVGTRLVTAYDDPALGGVYKLAAVRDAGGEWQPRLKLSEERIKTTNPSLQQVRRFVRHGRLAVDVIYDALQGAEDQPAWVDSDGKEHSIPGDAEGEDLLVPVLRDGERAYEPPPLDEVRERGLEQVESLDPAVRRVEEPEPHSVGLDPRLHRLKNELMEEHQ